MSVGMPAQLLLQEFGDLLWDVFGDPPYHVGSSSGASKGAWRDVDVRVMLDDEVWRAWFPDLELNTTEGDWQKNAKWVGLVLAFSALGKQMTGLPIDFQIQPTTYANRVYSSPKHPRSALGLVPHRWVK